MASKCLRSVAFSQYESKPGCHGLEGIHADPCSTPQRISGEVNAPCIGVDKVNADSCSSSQRLLPPTVKVEHCDINLINSLRDGIVGTARTDMLSASSDTPSASSKILPASKGVAGDNYVDGLDCISLRARKGMLQLRKLSGSMKPMVKGSMNASVRKRKTINVGEDAFSFQSSCFVAKEDVFGCFMRQTSSSKVNAEIVDVGNIATSAADYPRHFLLPATEKAEYRKNIPVCSSGDVFLGAACSDKLAVNKRHNIADNFLDELDHFPLKVRKRMLLSRKPVGVMKPMVEGGSEFLLNQVMGSHDGVNFGETELHYRGSLLTGEPSPTEAVRSTIPYRTSGSSLSNAILSGQLKKCSPVDPRRGTESIKSGNCAGVKDSFMGSTCAEISHKDGPSDCNNVLIANKTESRNSRKCKEFHESLGVCLLNSVSAVSTSCVAQAFGQYTIPSVVSSTSVQIKDEPFANSSLDESLGDVLDHIPLQDRIKLLTPGDVSSKYSSHFQCFERTAPHLLESRSVVSEPVGKRLRKRKKTATDSVETALEEDAPGLLQALVDKGVSMEEIKLYGDKENDDAIDLPEENTFSELEAVISKV